MHLLQKYQVVSLIGEPRNWVEVCFTFAPDYFIFNLQLNARLKYIISKYKKIAKGNWHAIKEHWDTLE